MSNNIPSIDFLQKEKSVKENSKIDIFNVVLNKCIEKIVYTNRHTDKTFVIFEVPKILIGYPMYDMRSCILFLINRLSKKGYLIEFIEPFYLYIDWGCKNNSNLQNINTLSSSVKNNPKLQKHTKYILERFPDTSKIEFVYEDNYRTSNSKKNNKKSNKRR